MREEMGDLFALLQDLGDRIANKVDCGSGTQHDEDDAVESRFRAVLPALLDRSFTPLKGRERELVAILKLLCMMVKYFPGVFHHGQGQSIVPILSRIIPLFAKCELRACHEGLLEALSAFMSLLQAGNPEIYQRMFADSIFLIDDLASIASFYSSERSFTQETKLSIHCYGRTFSALLKENGEGKEPRTFGDLQADHGILVSVSGEASWQCLAEWTIRLLGRCLQEGSIYLEGVLRTSVISRVAILFCYGNSILQMACFEFIRIASSFMDMESCPIEKLIMLLITILSFSGSDLLPFSGTFDSALGACLFSLCTVCQRGTLECVAQAFINVMPQTVKRTSSPDLKVVMLEVFSLILKQCPSLALDLSSTLEIICLSGVGSSLHTAQLVVKLPEPAKVAVEITGFSTMGTAHKKIVVEMPGTSSTSENSGLLWETRRTEENQSRPTKRQRQDTRRDSTLGILPELVGQSTAELAVKDLSRDHMQSVDLPIGEMVHPLHKDASIIIDLTPAVHEPQQEVLRLLRELTPQSNVVCTPFVDGKLTCLSVLIQWFGGVPETVEYHELVQLFHDWLSWTYKKVQEGSLMRLHTLNFLKAMETMLENDKGTGAGSHSLSSILQLSLLRTSEHLRLIQSILLYPWSSQVFGQEMLSTKLKCRAVRIAGLICGATEESNMELTVKQALQDEEIQVRTAAVRAIPNVIKHASSETILEFCGLVSCLAKDNAEQVREAVPAVVGFMSCIYYATFAKKPSQEKQILGRQVTYGKAKQPNYICPWCDCEEFIWSRSTTERDPVEMEDDSIACPLVLWQSLFSELLFSESSEHVQVSFIGCMSRLLRHATADQIGMTRMDWLECLDVLPIHRHRSVREAFCLQIKTFTESHVLAGVFGLVDDSEANQELQMLGKLKHALCISPDPDILDTLIETIAKVATFSGHRRQLFFFSLVLLLEQLDNKDLSLRCKSVLLIREIISMSFQETGSQMLPSMVDSIRDELYEYLINRLLSRPLMIQEFSEAVLGIKFVVFLKQMVPVILPKLVLSQQYSQQALDTLNELARTLSTDLPLLLLEWCHKVLSVLLLRADGVELMAALQFYEAQTGSDPREIFAAVLPALLDELVRFLGDIDNEEAQQRSARVAPMMQEVARIVTGSDDLPAFLKGHFVGLLNSIDRKLLRAEDVISQKQALRCIERLVEMIGTHLSAFVPKILGLLTRALQDARLRISGLKVWLSFVRTLIRTAPASAKSVASQVVVALMPFLEESEDEQNAVVEVFEELLVISGALLGDQAKELPILPSLPSLGRVNAVLHEARGSLSLRDRLRQAVDGLNHESMSVRYMTGNELRRIMRSQRTNITAMLAGESAADIYVLSKLVTVLLRGCGEESRTAVSQKLKMACAECLGELGAVDPAKLQVDLRRQSRIERSDEDLIFDLINEHLARVLRAATDTDIQDAAALAIQELLKLSGCQAALLGRVPQTTGDSEVSKDASSGMPKALARKRDEASALAESGEQLWRRFVDDIRVIITPCLTSKYFLRNSGGSISAGTIYQSGISFRRWIYLWIRRLISQSSGRRADIFVACTSVVRHDMETALYLLPYLVLGVVCDGSLEARDSVKEEILAVLAQASSIASKSATCLGSRHAKLIRGVPGPSEVSTQTVFSLIDTLGQWLDDCKLSAMGHSLQQSTGPGRCTSTENSEVKVACGQVATHRKNVLQLLAAIPKEALAGASFRCRAYARALLYFETHVREKSGALNPSLTSGVFVDEDVTFLLEIYNELDEPDGLAGLSRLRMSTSLQDQILINEKAGNWGEALTCCEQALQMEPASVTQHSRVLDCLLNMGHLQAMVTHVDGLVSRLPKHKGDWSMHGIQAAWRLGQWDLLEEYVRGTDGDCPSPNGDEDNAAFDISLSRILQALQKRDLNIFTKQIMQSRQALLAPLAAASMESYTRAYPFIVKLHMLQELEDFSSLATEALKEEIDCSQLRVSMTETVKHWESRLKITQPSLWTREPILALRRLILSANELRSEIGICWLQYAKLCRAAGHYETANRAILQAQSEGAPNAHVEMAKLLWDTRRSHRAIAELQQGLSNVSHSVRSNAFNPALNGLLRIDEQLPLRQGPQGAEKRRLGSGLNKIPSQARSDKDLDTAKTLLLLARWVHHTGQLQKDEVVSLYSQVKDLQPKWEKGWFFMAKYFDDLLVDARRRQDENSETGPHSGAQNRNLTTVSDKLGWDYLPDVLLFYAKGLHKGHCHLFQAMPRLLTLWFEFGSCFLGDSLASNRGLKGVHSRVMGIVRGCLKDLPTYQWLTSLPQLVSRICHQNVEVVRIVKHVISSVLQTYPQQAMWTMAAVTKSIVAARQETAAEIILQARNALGQNREKMVLFTQFASLIDQMICLCNFSGQPRAKLISLASEFSYLKRLMPVGVIMPLQRALFVTLPANGLTDVDYDPFPAAEFATISGIADEIEILASLQKPKKVVLRGSDGVEHPFLCKPKDDLRKDARMMEFTTMINRLLSKDPNSRRRKLYIRTFAVVPLSEDCGMIEWVLHTRGLRHMLQDLYVACGKFDRQKTNPAIKRMYDEQQAQKGAEKISEMEMLQTKILPLFPPVLHRWFLNMFPEPAAWFQARVAYAHTTAVWSMVGHIVGLGDRHGENILFDSTTGDCVHVDFSCLFDKGLQLEKPELVPFRLTQNMVDGLGITGYEGVFLRVCEITLNVLRSHRETLMSVLETFLHDPLVEWTKSHKSSCVEVQNPHAQKAIANIVARLEGVVVGVAAAPSLPLSVEGQAHRLIAEAVSHQNLSKMYIWWMPWF